MKLHENEGLFRDLIQYTAEKYRIPEVYIEKDYWVTRVLHCLSNSDYKDDFIFKGGTSLSKAYKLIHRFSEDVDLAVFKNGSYSPNQLKRRIVAAEKTLTEGLVYAQREGESKNSSFRKVYFEFPRLINGDFGHASDVILLEINSFASPEPFNPMPVQTLIADFILASDKPELIEEFNLAAFPVNVLDIERTVAEKIIGLVRASRMADPITALADKIRHIYDLCLINRDASHVKLFSSGTLPNMIQIVINADREQFKNAGDWLDEPLDDSAIFSNSRETWANIQSVFHGSFAELVYNNDLPDDEEVISMLMVVQAIFTSMKEKK